jgi:hypothetical protein
MRALCLVLALVFMSSVALAAQGSTVTIRCPEPCSVLLEGKPGQRLSDSHWEFTDVPPGKRRIEVKGLLGRPLVSSFVDIPKTPQAGVYLDAKGALKVSGGTAAPSTAAGKGSPKPKKGKVSVLHVRCQRLCSVSVDHARRSSGSTHTTTVQDVTPGTHSVEVSFAFGGGDWRDSIQVPPASEVFVYASDAGLQVTNTRRLGK